MFEIGGSLREARLKRGLSPADVQKAIRIRDRYLQALEEERWELLPGDAYVKGFLRTYADFLGLDGSLYVDEYNGRYAHTDEPTLVPERFERARKRPRRGGFLRPLVLVGALVAAVAAVAAWQLSGGSGKKQAAPPTTAPPTTTPPATTTQTQHKKHTFTPVTSSHAVVVASRGSSWLWVRSGSATGPTVYEGTLLQGKTLRVSLAGGAVWIRMGDPPNLDVRVGGRLMHGLPTQVGNVLLTRGGIRPA